MKVIPFPMIKKDDKVSSPFFKHPIIGENVVASALSFSLLFIFSL
jgi:hypothetical protein